MADKAHSQQSCSDQGLPLSCTPHPFITLNVAAGSSGGTSGMPNAQQSCSGQVLIAGWGPCQL